MDTQRSKRTFLGSHSLVVPLVLTLTYFMDCSPPGFSVHGNSPGKNTGVGCHALLQGIFTTQGLNPDLLHCRPILYCPIYQGNLRILGWVTYPFFRGFSQTRNRTGDTGIGDRFFTTWTTREALFTLSNCICCSENSVRQNYLSVVVNQEFS